MKNFLLQNVVRADIFPVLWQFLKNAASPLAGEPQKSRGLFLAAAGGEESPPQNSENAAEPCR